jgi:signal transduction histidine kinase
VTLPIPRWLRAVLASAVLIAAVTAVIALLEPRVPALGLGVLYLLAIVPVALLYGVAVASVVSVASMAAFSYFCLPPKYSFDLSTSERASGLAALLVSSLVVSELAARSQREARRSARLADEQAALRRVATLVVRGIPAPDVFGAAARELGELLGVDATHMARFEPDGTGTGVAAWSPAGDQIPVGTRVDLEGDSVAGMVLRTRRPARMQDYENAPGAGAALGRELGLRASVGAPIVVDQRLWGVMIASAKRDGSLPADAEPRIAAFTELLATAISSAEARTEVGRLVDEQAALRRVATLVAEGAPSAEVFQTVTREVGILSGADLARMERYESDDSVIGVAGWSRGEASELAVGKRFSLEGASIAAMVQEAIRPVRVDSFVGAHGPIAEEAQALGIRSSVGCPIVVEGRLWGVIAASSKSEAPFPRDTESQIAEFTELVATAISNSEARTEVAASRARIVAAADEERRRVVRDLHDGAQARLVHTVVTLKLAQRALQAGEADVAALLTQALDSGERATVELRELTHGILPTVLTKGGLRPAVDSLASRMSVPVEIDVAVGRLPTAVEATAYFIVAEALTNVAKHARAAHAEVTARIEDGTLAIQVRDDGVGGARLGGSGLIGLTDRLATLDGELEVKSPRDGGTLVAAAIPIPG